MKPHPCALAVLALAALGTPAHAITWDGYSTILPGTTLAQRPELVGDVIASQDIQVHVDQNGPNVGFPDVILHNYVVRESASGTLDFYFQLTSTSTKDQNIFQMEITGFDIGPSLDVDQLVNGTSYAKFFAARLSLAPYGPDEIGTGSPTRGTGTFLLAPGQSTAPLFIHTNATLFDTSGTFTFIPDQIPEGTFAPLLGGGLGSVPEPASLALLPIAAAALALRFRRP